MPIIYKYEQVKETYNLTDSGKSWKSKPSTIETEVLTEERYNNTVSKDTQAFFRRLGGSETAQRSYTMKGYIVTRLTSINPSRDEKIVRKFLVMRG